MCPSKSAAWFLWHVAFDFGPRQELTEWWQRRVASSESSSSKCGFDCRSQEVPPVQLHFCTLKEGMWSVKLDVDVPYAKSTVAGGLSRRRRAMRRDCAPWRRRQPFSVSTWQGPKDAAIEISAPTFQETVEKTSFCLQGKANFEFEENCSSFICAYMSQTPGLKTFALESWTPCRRGQHFFCPFFHKTQRSVTPGNGPTTRVWCCSRTISRGRGKGAEGCDHLNRHWRHRPRQMWEVSSRRWPGGRRHSIYHLELDLTWSPGLGSSTPADGQNPWGSRICGVRSSTEHIWFHMFVVVWILYIVCKRCFLIRQVSEGFFLPQISLHHVLTGDPVSIVCKEPWLSPVKSAIAKLSANFFIASNHDN